MCALWAGTTLNTNRLSTLVDQYTNMTALPAIAKDCGLLFAFLGKPMEDYQTPVAGMGFERLSRVAGDELSVRLLGQVKAVEKVANYTGELAARTVAGKTNLIGRIKIPFTHYADAMDIPSSELDQFVGNEAKTEAWLQTEVAQYIRESILDTWANDLSNSTPALPASDTLGNIAAAIDDGTTTQYYPSNGAGIDRTDAANAWFKSYLKSLSGPVTLSEIRLAKAKIREARGQADLISAPTALYVKLEGAVEAYSQVNYDKRWSEFGGQWCRYAGMTLIQDHRMSTTSIYIYTSKSWIVGQKETRPFKVSEIMRNPAVKAGWLLPFESYLAIGMRHGGQNGVLTNVTG